MSGDRFVIRFASAVRRHRIRLDMSQELLAEKAGIHRNFVGMIERGERVPTIKVANQLAKVLQRRFSELVAEAEREEE